jgi:hypothetical protein
MRRYGHAGDGVLGNGVDTLKRYRRKGRETEMRYTLQNSQNSGVESFEAHDNFDAKKIAAGRLINFTEQKYGLLRNLETGEAWGIGIAVIASEEDEEEEEEDIDAMIQDGRVEDVDRKIEEAMNS